MSDHSKTKPLDPSIPAPTGIEAELCRMSAQRQLSGLAKYGVSLAENPLPLKEWLLHSLLEKLDDCAYMLRAIKQIEAPEAEHAHLPKTSQ